VPRLRPRIQPHGRGGQGDGRAPGEEVRPVLPVEVEQPVKVLNRTKNNNEKQDDECSLECLKIIKEHPLFPAVVTLVYWKDPARSGLVFLSLNLIFYLISCGGYTALSLSLYVFFLLLLASLGFTLFYSKFKGTPNALEERFKNADFSISREFADAHGHVLHELLEGIRVYVGELLLCKNWVSSVKAVFACYFLSSFFGWFNLTTLVWLGTIIAFASPKIYEMQEEEINKGLKKGNEMYKLYLGMAMEQASTLPVLSSFIKGKTE